MNNTTMGTGGGSGGVRQTPSDVNTYAMRQGDDLRRLTKSTRKHVCSCIYPERKPLW